jgi:ligand-binding sensor domain-containing protein/two-component sensor histidine kinase
LASIEQLRKRPRWPRLGLVLALLLIYAGDLRPRQLPIKIYTLDEGLAHDRVGRIVRDSRGFLWLCTADGISRFDGYRFVTYDSRHGLPNPSTNDLLETRAGVYWIATNGSGVARLEATATGAARSGRASQSIVPLTSERDQGLFKIYTVGDKPGTNRVNRLFEDREGRLWAGTDDGLFVLEAQTGAEQKEFRPVEVRGALANTALMVWDIKEDGEQNIWFATTQGLWRRRPDGELSQYRPAAIGRTNFQSLLFDREGHLWAGHARGVLVFKPDSETGAAVDDSSWQDIARPQQARAGERVRLPEARGEAASFTPVEGPIDNQVFGLYQTTDGHIWVAMRGGLAEFADDHFTSYTNTPRLSPHSVLSLCEDRAGNLWIGTYGGGALKLARNGFTAFGKDDGLGGGTAHIIHLFESAAGELMATNRSPFIYHFDGERFVEVRPQLAPDVKVVYHVMQDRAGEWWVSTSIGLYRFAAAPKLKDLERARPLAVYTTREGLNGNFVQRTFEDSRGDIWIGSNGPGMISRWERATNTLHRHEESEGLPHSGNMQDIEEDRTGTIWFSFRDQGVVLFRRGRFERLPELSHLTGNEVLNLFLDHAGRLWLAVNSIGLIRLDDPAAEHPRLTTYTMSEGLSTNIPRVITEDDRGQLYVGTMRGIDRLDPSTGSVKHYSTADGLAATETTAALRDRHGVLWFGSLLGLSRFRPVPEETTPPPVFISGLQVAGVPYKLSPLGETRIENLLLEPNQRQIQIDFFALGFAPGEALRYQYRIEGEGQGWSAPTDQRTLNLNLSPGSYRVEVRAVNGEGEISPEPASISFTIRRPLWQRWWFLALAAIAMIGIVYTTYRDRVRRLIELERVRTRIATDLHDDIGASLSRMAILSEVVKHQTGGNGNQTSGLLTEIADSARGLVDSMGDIVWSIDPRRDDLQSVARRIRQFASDVLEAKGIDWEFRVPPEVEGLRLGPDERRHLFLIFKEGINNIARHGDGTKSVSLSLKVEGKHLVGEILDDGRGFVPAAPSDARSKGRGGNGLPNMRERAGQLGGHLDIASSPGAGTRLTLKMPLK